MREAKQLAEWQCQPHIILTSDKPYKSSLAISFQKPELQP